ncbi:MAG: class I SAM-dependent methyltransferase [Acidimicrobiia bacterium]
MADVREVGWPFWAPSDLSTVEAALDLAGVARGDHFVDLGCGDGQVLVAAARRGAQVLGVEIDDDLAATARAALEAEGLPGTVVVADLFDLDLDADVVFTYLSPGTLQRLTPALRALRGARLVTVDFEVPDLVVDDVAGTAHLYRLPGRRRRRGSPGWPAAGTLIVTVAGYESLSVLHAVHPGGPVEVATSTPLARAGSFRPGLDDARPGQHLAVDVRWEGHAAGTVATGTVEVAGLAPHHLTVCFTDDEEAQGAWDLDPGGVADLAIALADRRPPTTPDGLLAVLGA